MFGVRWITIRGLFLTPTSTSDCSQNPCFGNSYGALLIFDPWTNRNSSENVFCPNMILFSIELNPALIHCNCNGEILLRFDLFKTFHNFFITSIVMQAQLGKRIFWYPIVKQTTRTCWCGFVITLSRHSWITLPPFSISFCQNILRFLGMFFGDLSLHRPSLLSTHFNHNQGIDLGFRKIYKIPGIVEIIKPLLDEAKKCVVQSTVSW